MQIIKSFKFADNRLRFWELADGEIFLCPIDFDGRPYNTYAIVWACDLLLLLAYRENRVGYRIYSCSFFYLILNSKTIK